MNVPRKSLIEYMKRFQRKDKTVQLVLIVLCILIPQMSGFAPLNAGYTVSVRRTRMNDLVLSTLARTGESPTCIFHESIHTP